MLSFFRRIRKGLLDIGAARKYLLYALGEVLLVMVGILLALQVNNWNEERKERSQGREYINQIYKDILEDIEQIDGINEELEIQFESSVVILEVVENIKNKEIDSEALFFRMRNLGSTVGAMRIHKTWDAMVLAGNQNAIHNKSLGSLLSEYYTNYDIRIAHFNLTPLQTRNKVRQFLLSEKYTSADLHIRSELKTLTVYSMQRLNGWLRNPDCADLIGVLGITSLNNINHFNKIKEEANSIISYLEENHSDILRKE